MTADSSSLSSVTQVERASFEFRCGRPVCIVSPEGDVSMCLATERLSAGTFEQLRRLGEGRMPTLVLTHHRARTMKIRLYTPGVVRVPCPDWLTVDQIRQLADPQFDLTEPLRGPFLAERSPVPASVSASIELAKISRLLPSTLCVSLPSISQGSDPDIVRAGSDAIRQYHVEAAAALHELARARVPLAEAEDCRMVAFREAGGGAEHFAIIIGDPKPPGPVLTRLHSECFTGDLLGSLKCDCGQQLRGAIAAMRQHGEGILLYLAQEGRGIGLLNKLRAYALQDQGFDTVEANQRLGFEDDEREFYAAAEMLRSLRYSSVRLMSNNPRKIALLEACGIQVVERVSHNFPTNTHNEAYMAVKASKSGHILG